MSCNVPTLAHAGASGRVVPASIEISPSLREAIDRAAPVMIRGVYRSDRDRGLLSRDEREASTPHLVAASPGR